MQIPRFTSSKPSEFALASDEKSIRRSTTSFVRRCLKIRRKPPVARRKAFSFDARLSGSAGYVRPSAAGRGGSGRAGTAPGASSCSVAGNRSAGCARRRRRKCSGRTTGAPRDSSRRGYTLRRARGAAQWKRRVCSPVSGRSRRVRTSRKSAGRCQLFSSWESVSGMRSQAASKTFGSNDRRTTRFFA